MRILSFHEFKRYFFTGLFIIVPAWGTILILYTLLDALEQMTVDLVWALYGITIPGSGITFFCLLVLWVGMGTNYLVGQRIHQKLDYSLEQIPFVRSIYLTLKSMADVLNFRERFGQSKVVAFPFPREGLWALGFEMGFPPSGLQVSPEGKLVMVFVPTGHPSLYRVFGVCAGAQHKPHSIAARRSHENGIFSRAIPSSSRLAETSRTYGNNSSP